MIGPFIGPALAGYIGAGSNWKVSFGILTVFYGISTILIFIFGYETYFVKGRQCQRNSRLQSILGIKNHNLPVGRTLGYWTKLLAIYIFKLPLLLTGIATMVNFCWPIGMLGFCFNFSYRISILILPRHHCYCFNVRCQTSLSLQYGSVRLIAMGAHHRWLDWYFFFPCPILVSVSSF